jgi:hypothetical protein
LFLAVVAVVSGSALVQACAASGGEGSDDSSQAGGDATTGTGDSQTTVDGSPVATGDTGTPSVDGGSDASDAASTCVLTPPSDKCGIFPNCGCAGTTCDFVLDSGEANLPTACTPFVGTAAGGAPCNVTTDCQQSLTCVNGKCHEFCANSGDPCTGIYSACRNHAATTGFNICGIKCDLTDATSCGTEGCVAVAAGSSAVTTDCEPVGSQTLGQACTNPLDCAPGLNCVDTTSKQCKLWCVVGSMCAGSVACESYGTPLTIGGTEYGYCP